MKMGTDAGEPPINVPARGCHWISALLIYVESKKKQNKKARLPQKEIRFVASRKGDKELEEGGQKAQTSS